MDRLIGTLVALAAALPAIAAVAEAVLPHLVALLLVLITPRLVGQP